MIATVSIRLSPDGKDSPDELIHVESTRRLGAAVSGKSEDLDGMYADLAERALAAAQAAANQEQCDETEDKPA